MIAMRSASAHNGNFSKPRSLVASNLIVIPQLVMYHAYFGEPLVSSGVRQRTR
jgi:hypothetical protein